MKILLMMGLAAMTFAQTAKTAPKAAATVSIPKDAEKIGPYQWRHTDSKGQKWIYRQTAFGIQKAPEPPAEERLPDYQAPVKVTEQGDQVTFERQSGFGVQKWTRAKSALTAEERQMWEQAQRRSGAGK